MAAAAALLYLVLSLWVGWREVLDALRSIGLGVFLGLLVLSLLNFGLRIARWQFLLTHLGHRLPWRPNARIYLAGFALTVTPGKVGELMRGALLGPLGVPLTTSNALFLVERFSDLLAVLILAALVFRAHPLAWPLMLGTWALIGLSLWLAHQTRWIAAGQRICEARSGNLARVGAHLCQLLLEFRRCFEWRPLLLGLLLGFAAWGAQGLAFYWLLNALGTSLGADAALFTYALGLIAGVVSFLPGGLGGSEAAMILLLIWQGVGRATAITATIVMQLAALWFAVVVGLLALGASRRND